MLGKISSYPTYPIAVILKMAMHLEDPERTAPGGRCPRWAGVRSTHLGCGKSAIDMNRGYVKIMTLDVYRVPIIRIDDRETKGGPRNANSRSAWDSPGSEDHPMATVSRPSPNGQPAVRSSRPRREPSGIARLELLINGTRYKMRSTSLGTISEVRTWRLRKADGTIHIVGQQIDGFITCTCKDSIARKSAKTRCKHILSLLAVGLFDQRGGAE